jgi:hypothetical protein
MLLDNIVLSAMLQNIGTQSPKNVLHANRDIPGIAIPMNAHVVKPQDQLLMESALAHPQKLNGMQIPSNAFAHQTHSVTIVNYVHHQEFGTGIKTNVYAHHQQATGTKLQENVNVQLEDMDQTVSLVHHQDIGTSTPINVLVKAHWFGLEVTVHAHNHGSHGKEAVLNVHLDMNGLITDASNATATTKIYKL